MAIMSKNGTVYVLYIMSTVVYMAAPEKDRGQDDSGEIL